MHQYTNNTWNNPIGHEDADVEEEDAEEHSEDMMTIQKALAARMSVLKEEVKSLELKKKQMQQKPNAFAKAVSAVGELERPLPRARGNERPREFAPEEAASTTPFLLRPFTILREKRSKMVNANRLRAALLLGLVVAFGLCMYCMALVSSLDSCKSAHEELVDREGELAEELLMCEQQHDDLQREYLAVTAILEDQRLGLDPIKEEESDAPTPAQAAPSDQSAGRLEGQVQQENLARAPASARGRQRVSVDEMLEQALSRNWPIAALLVGAVGVMALVMPTAQQLHAGLFANKQQSDHEGTQGDKAVEETSGVRDSHMSLSDWSTHPRNSQSVAHARHESSAGSHNGSTSSASAEVVVNRRAARKHSATQGPRGKTRTYRGDVVSSSTSSDWFSIFGQ